MPSLRLARFMLVGGVGFVVDAGVLTLALRYLNAPIYGARMLSDRSTLRAYDRFVFPVSRWVDRALKGVLGKNVLLVAERRR